jgi:radical SAM superfamily enzyme YgiQ (UPF0313 family)/selenocysteine lyase/cysteine desulfurase
MRLRTVKQIPPELLNNFCHIAPEWERETKQKLWLVSAPYGGSVLRFQGEPTSLLYAIAPLIDEIKKADRGEASLISGLTMRDVALLNPSVASEKLYLELAQRIQKQDLRAICISCLTASSPEARRIAALVKSINPRTITIVGGPHEDDMVVRTAVDPDFERIVDFSISGDGEYALVHLAKIIFDHPQATIEEIKGLVCDQGAMLRSQCKGRGHVHFRYRGQAQTLPLKGNFYSRREGHDPREWLVCLDDLPLMPRELVHEADTRTFSVFKKGGRNVKTAQIMTQRGCAWRCSFCSESAVFEGKTIGVNVRSVASIKREIEEIKYFNERLKERHLKEGHLDIERDNYEAIFFDDSTFTDRRPRRAKFLNELYALLEQSGLEWGCQTRLDQIDEEILAAMKQAGCTYVFTGLESASEEMLRAMIKEEGRRDIEGAFSAINKVGMRMGLSLIFGVANLGSNGTSESKETILETLDFVRDQTRQGNIVLVSPNVATYYPSTLMTTSAQTNFDFRHPLIHRSYPWNRFEEGEGYHPQGVDARIAEFIIQESIARFGEYMVEQDIYSIGGYAEAYRDGELERAGLRCTDFNHASISRPLPKARAAAAFAAKFVEVTAKDRERLLNEARNEAGRLMGLSEEQSDQVVLTRNATEAAGLTFWLAGFTPTTMVKIVTTNAENLSIPRAFRFQMDHGNPQGRDLWSSYQDFGVINAKEYLADRRATRVEVAEVDVLSDTGRAEELILARVKHELGNQESNLRFVIFSHVIRDDGRICNAKWLCERIREITPSIFILVDGAQALGALPSVDVESIGCDFYIAAPHKTLESFPMGLLYMSERARANAGKISLSSQGWPRCIIMEGMFSPAINVRPTVETPLSLPEVVGFTAAIEDLAEQKVLNGNNCDVLDQHRFVLKKEFIDSLVNDLGRVNSVEITSACDDRHSNFILTFRFLGIDNRHVVEKLWTEHLVFVSYIARSDVIRVSFSSTNTMDDVKRALQAIKSSLQGEAAFTGSKGHLSLVA